MKLSNLLKALSIQADDSRFSNTQIQGLTSDSRKVRPGDLFIAYAGTQTDSRQYITSVIAQGAQAILYEDTPDFSFNTSTVSIPIIPVKNLSRHLGNIASMFYEHPSNFMQMVGITGTNGKTTCTQLIAQTLHSAGICCGVVGTLGYGFPPEPLTANTHTTPDPITLQHQLATLQKKTSITAMEVSSHALQQQRVQGIAFDIAVFTNLSRDHLDYHETMENYWTVKQRLFKDYPIKHAIINLDDPYGVKLINAIGYKTPIIGYTLQADRSHSENFPLIIAEHIRLSPKGIQAKINSPWGEGILKSSLLGRFNLSNLLAALGAISLLNLNLTFEDLLFHLSKAKAITGRMQTLGGKKQPLIVVDYAHTPDALQESLMALREHTQGKLWCVFGCGGDRDSGKRPLMGKIAEHYSDQLIITDDNPRHENPASIVEQIISGLSCPWAAEIEHDRKVAIAHAVDCATAGDIILIAGKGHESYQHVFDKKIAFNDVEQAQLALDAKALSQI